jgi:flagellar export protein FliJ
VKRFRFRLDSVLRFRAHELDRRRLELKAAQVEARKSAEHLARARAAASSCAQALRARAAAGLTAAELVSARRGTAALYTEVLRAERGLRESAARAAAARARLIEARTRVQALERLRQRARDAYLGEFRRLEQVELDEVGGRMAADRRSAP